MKSIATVTIRLLAVSVFAASAIQFPASGAGLVQLMIQVGLSLPSVVLYSLALVFSALVAPIILWYLAPWLSHRITRHSDAIAGSPFSEFDAFRLGIILLGLFLLPGALAQVAASIYTLASGSPSIEASQRFAYDQGLRQALISSGMQLFMAAVFIAFSSRIAKVLVKIR